MTTPITPPNTPMAVYEQPRPNPMKKAKFTFDVDLPPNGKRHQKLTEDQLKALREKFFKKDNS